MIWKKRVLLVMNAYRWGILELRPWEWPESAWHRLHVDYDGPENRKYFFIIEDAHWKLVEIHPTSVTTAKDINCLSHTFSQFGFPVSIVSDNGLILSSEKSKQLTKLVGTRHLTHILYKPGPNSLAERMVQMFKRAIKSSKDPLLVALDRFLYLLLDWYSTSTIIRFVFIYRMTPHSFTGVSPTELLFGKKLRSRLDLLRTFGYVSIKVSQKQEAQKCYHTSNPRKVSWSPVGVFL